MSVPNAGSETAQKPPSDKSIHRTLPHSESVRASFCGTRMFTWTPSSISFHLSYTVGTVQSRYTHSIYMHTSPQIVYVWFAEFVYNSIMFALCVHRCIGGFRNCCCVCPITAPLHTWTVLGQSMMLLFCNGVQTLKIPWKPRTYECTAFIMYPSITYYVMYTLCDFLPIL